MWHAQHELERVRTSHSTDGFEMWTLQAAPTFSLLTLHQLRCCGLRKACSIEGTAGLTIGAEKRLIITDMIQRKVRLSHKYMSILTQIELTPVLLHERDHSIRRHIICTSQSAPAHRHQISLRMAYED